MQKYLKEYNFWLENDYFDADTKKELKLLQTNDKEIEERFYKDLEFGTGGLRGIIGAGTNRINIYTIRKASQGLSNYVLSKGEEAKKRGIVIAYDSRFKSPEFALAAAEVFAGNGIKTFLFDELRPTPELSFAVRHLNAFAGVVVTASHNPKEYNGYKVYGEDGAQLAIEGSEIVLNEINKLPDMTKVTMMDSKEAIQKHLLQIIGKEVDDAYIKKLKTVSIDTSLSDAEKNELKIVYTPIHGSGNKLVKRILDETGFKNVFVVAEQEKPDSSFSTVKSPNPENIDVFEYAIKLAKEKEADLIIGTDPDSDRMGVAVKNNNGEYIILNGNQMGCMLTEFILSSKQKDGSLPQNGFVVKTIVSTNMVKAIANHYKVELVEVLTGFKFIGEKIKLMDEFGDKKFLFGFEESFGCLAGTFVRDKDAVVSSMLAAQMACNYKKHGMSLYDGLQEMYKKYGYFEDGVMAYTLEGKDGVEKIEFTMNQLRNDKDTTFDKFVVKELSDYLESIKYDITTGEKHNLTLPQSDVLYYEMKDGSWFCIRPSGTEPKIKLYFGVSDNTHQKAKDKMIEFKKAVLEVIEGHLL